MCLAEVLTVWGEIPSARGAARWQLTRMAAGNPGAQPALPTASDFLIQLVWECMAPHGTQVSLLTLIWGCMAPHGTQVSLLTLSWGYAASYCDALPQAWLT